MSIVTKKGDSGETSLASGRRISKAHARIDTYGTLDELVSFLGLARSFITDEDAVDAHIKKIQGDLFLLGSELAQNVPVAGEKPDTLREEHLKYVESLIEEFEPHLQKINKFIIPGGTTASAALDVTRTVCRRLERKLVALKESQEFENPVALKYINRLSDLLFIFARYV